MPTPDPRDPQRAARPASSTPPSPQASGGAGGEDLTSYSVVNEDTPAPRKRKRADHALHTEKGDAVKGKKAAAEGVSKPAAEADTGEEYAPEHDSAPVVDAGDDGLDDPERDELTWCRLGWMVLFAGVLTMLAAAGGWWALGGEPGLAAKEALLPTPPVEPRPVELEELRTLEAGVVPERDRYVSEGQQITVTLRLPEVKSIGRRIEVAGEYRVTGATLDRGSLERVSNLREQLAAGDRQIGELTVEPLTSLELSLHPSLVGRWVTVEVDAQVTTAHATERVDRGETVEHRSASVRKHFDVRVDDAARVKQLRAWELYEQALEDWDGSMNQARYYGVKVTRGAMRLGPWVLVAGVLLLAFVVAHHAMTTGSWRQGLGLLREGFLLAGEEEDEA